MSIKTVEEVLKEFEFENVAVEFQIHGREGLPQTHVLTFHATNHKINLIMLPNGSALESLSYNLATYALSIDAEEIATRMEEARGYCLEIFPQGKYNRGYNAHSWSIHTYDGTNYGEMIAGEKLVNGMWVQL